MAVCHETKTKCERNRLDLSPHHVHLDEEDTEEILAFARTHSINFACACSIAEQLFYILQVDGGEGAPPVTVKILILHRFAFSLNKFALIGQKENGSKFLFIRDTVSTGSSPQTLPVYLANTVSADRKLRFEGFMTEMRKQGLKVIFYS